MLKVSALVVAYNNPKELSSCIQRLANQTFRVDSLIVVDNSSSNYSSENQDLLITFESFFNKVFYLFNKDNNRGSAKGFEIGMRFAFDSVDFDFLWLNDQDGLPSNECLKILVDAYTNNSYTPGVYAPSICSIEDGHEMMCFRCMVNPFLHEKGYKSNSDIVRTVKIAGTTGLLIHSDVIHSVGYYNGDVFGVGLEDFDYSLRVNKHFKIFLIKNAVYLHPDLSIKYSVKRRSKLAIFLKKVFINFVPLYFGFITSNQSENGFFRESRLCEGSSYFSKKYAKILFDLINYLFSCLKTIFLKIFCHKIKLRLTLDAYKLGRKKAKQEKDY